MNTTLLLEMAADAVGDRIAHGTGESALTYAELLDRARGVGSELARRGTRTLGYLGLNRPELPLLLFGAGTAGVAFAPLNYRLTDTQLSAALQQLAPITVAVTPDMAGRITATDGVDVVAVAQLDGPPDAAQLAAFVDPDEVAVILLTSGTSGPPKAALLRHQHLVTYIVSTVELASAGADEAILVSVPPYHVAAVSSMLSSTYSGRRIVAMPAFSADGWVDLALAESVTHAMVVPTMLGRILDDLEQRAITLPALRHLSYGGGRMPVGTVERALRLLPSVDLVNAYGLTETSSTIALLGPEDHRTAFRSADPVERARLGSVGRPLPSVEVEIRDGSGAILSAGSAGEIWVRGEQVSGEYLTHRATDPDGWYPTRDRGHLDAGGYLFLDGRSDDVIVRGGENIAPGEIEDVLLEHPAVAEAAVIGVPDQEWGERVEAFVVPATGQCPAEADLQEWVRGRLRSTRMPARVHLRESLPSTETGKLLRRVLRAELATPLREGTPE